MLCLIREVVGALSYGLSLMMRECILAFSSSCPPLSPVVCGQTGGGDERGGAHEHKVVSRLVVALQRLPESERGRLLSKRDSNREADANRNDRRVNVRTLTRFSDKKQNLKNLPERPDEPAPDAYQVRFGSVPACVGLPETQSSISINDAKL